MWTCITKGATVTMPSNSINIRRFISYKFFNSLFLGLSVGTIFIIYTPLEPSVYSLGGVLLALSMLVIAKFYTKILILYYFFRISFLVESVMLILISYFLLVSYGYTTALIIYIGYQSTFAFGSYLVRAETILLPKAKILTFLDVTKQKGYLAGMVLSYLFYKFLDLSFDIQDAHETVYLLHFLLLVIEVITMFYLYLAFTKSKG